MRQECTRIEVVGSQCPELPHRRVSGNAQSIGLAAVQPIRSRVAVAGKASRAQTRSCRTSDMRRAERFVEEASALIELVVFIAALKGVQQIDVLPRGALAIVVFRRTLVVYDGARHLLSQCRGIFENLARTFVRLEGSAF